MNILQEADKIINGDRAEAYGSVTESFSNIAKIWSVILKTTVTPEQVGLCMIQLKISRQMNKSQKDNLVDICGYAGCIDKMETEKQNK